MPAILHVPENVYVLPDRLMGVAVQPAFAIVAFCRFHSSEGSMHRFAVIVFGVPPPGALIVRTISHIPC